MCGIFGTINQSIPNRELLKKNLYHRGPDEQNFYEIDNLQFFFSRLAIQEISDAGSQPMKYKQFTIIFNGEIYNHRELRTKYDLHCQSRSDTETLIHLYEKLGFKMLEEIDGMFALAIYDSTTKKLFLARDRAGKKPLYIYKKNKSIAFSSEIKALQQQFSLSINEEAINKYFQFGYMFRQQSPYIEVEELLGGDYWIVDCINIEISKINWWNIENYYSNHYSLTFQEATYKIDQYLTTAVKRRIDSSDLEVGSFLSGGIDSGIVSSIAAQNHPKIKTFTVSFNNDNSFNEAPLARLVAEKYDTEHKEVAISFDNLKEDIEKIIGLYGEPFMDSSCIPSYYVAREAKQHITVVLNGDGADELFGGYRRYVPFSLFDFTNLNLVTQKAIEIVFNMLPYPQNKHSKYNFIHRLLDLSTKKGTSCYISATGDIFENYYEYFKQKPQPEPFIEDILKSNLSGLKKMQLLDFKCNLFSDLLVKMDIATMANSLEGRSPFLCKDLLEFAPQLPDKYKVNKLQTKSILRELAKKYLPVELIGQPKRGFEIPLKKWVNNELKEIIFSYLNNPSFACNFIDRRFIIDLMEKPEKFPEEKRAKMLYSLFCLEVWYNSIKS